MKVTLALPHALQPFLQAHPTTGFCQVGLPIASAIPGCICQSSITQLGAYIMSGVYMRSQVHKPQTAVIAGAL